MKPNRNSSAGTKDDSTTTADVTTSSQTIAKPNVGSSAFEVVKNYWICVHTSGMVALESLAYSKPQSIKNKLATWSKNKPISKWRYWKQRGWNCVKVNVNFSQVNTN